MQYRPPNANVDSGRIGPTLLAIQLVRCRVSTVVFMSTCIAIVIIIGTLMLTVGRINVLCWSPNYDIRLCR